MKIRTLRLTPLSPAQPSLQAGRTLVSRPRRTCCCPHQTPPRPLAPASRRLFHSTNFSNLSIPGLFPSVGHASWSIDWSCRRFSTATKQTDPSSAVCGLAYDFETTSAHAPTTEPVQIAVLYISDQSVPLKFVSYIMPEGPIDPG